MIRCTATAPSAAPITTEATTKWHEIHVTPHQADMVGLGVLATGLVLFFLGRAVAKAGRRSAAA